MRALQTMAGWLGVVLLLGGPLYPSFLHGNSAMRKAQIQTAPIIDPEPEVVNHHADPALVCAVRDTLRLLAKSDYPKLRKRFASRGVLVNKRELDWNQTQPLIDARRNGNAPAQMLKMEDGDDLTFGEAVRNVHVEDQAFFEPSEFRTSTFENVLFQFRSLVKQSREAYPTPLDIDDNLRPTGYMERYGGATVEGKLCSNWFWRMYFVQEAGEWKIWKLESEHTH